MVGLLYRLGESTRRANETAAEGAIERRFERKWEDD
jgi:hypothetical protein